MDLCRALLCTAAAVYLAAVPAAAGGKFAPPAGKTLLVVGQNVESIESYVEAVKTVPAGFMGYTSIRECEGLDEAFDNGAGEQNAGYLAGQYPEAVIQIGLYLVDALDQVVAGEYDENIDRLGAWIISVKRPVYLRIGYEFDNPENRYDPRQYAAAYRYIVDRLRANGVKNAAYVWHSFAAIGPHEQTAYYPGDDYVDWFGVSYFENQSSAALQRMVTLAREHGRPLMIAEASPARIGVHGGRQSYYKWYRPLFKFIEKNDVAMLCYINTDWNALPMFAGMQWGDCRVQENADVEALWRDEIRNARYMQSFPGLCGELSGK